MKYWLLSLMLLTAVPLWAQRWTNVGQQGFSAKAEQVSLAIGPDGTPYVAYRDNGKAGHASVMKFDGVSWTAVGAAGFSAGTVAYTTLAVDPQGAPYVAYKDGANGGRATAMKYDGTSWVVAGTVAFSPGPVAYTDLAITSAGVPYIAFKNGSNGKAAVMKYDGTNWGAVGLVGFSAGAVAYTILDVAADGTLYIAYEDAENGNKATVMKYDEAGTDWKDVGEAGFSQGAATYVSLAIGPGGTPYVAYSDAGNGNKATVLRYDGNGWVPVGGAGFSSGSVSYTSLAVSADGTPYVAYADAANGNKVTVMKYDSKTTGWVTVGSPGFSADQADYTSLAFVSGNTAYVAYEDYGSDNKVTAMRFSASTVPVTLSSFTGRLIKGTAKFEWKTGVEENFNHFELQKKGALPGDSYRTIGKIDPEGSGSAYSYSVTQPGAVAYYRLLMVDDNGTLKYSGEVTLSQKENAHLFLYPNPSTDYIDIKMTEADHLLIYDGTGKLVKTQSLHSGINTIDVHSLGAGVYYGTVGNKRLKFIKK